MATTVEQRKIEIIANGKKADASFKEIVASVSLLNNQLKKMKPGTKEFIDKSEELKKSKKRLGEVKDQMYGVKEAQQDVTNEMARFIPFSGKLGMVTNAFKSLKVAMIAIPIFALVAAFGALFQWFKRTEEGAQALRVITAALGQVMNSLMDVVSKGGKILFDTFSNPKQAVKDLGNTIKDFVLGRVELLMKGIDGLGVAFNLLMDGEFKKAAKKAGNSLIEINRGINPLAMAIEGTGKAAVSMGTAFKDIYSEVKKDVEGAVELQHRENALIRQKREFLLREVELQDQISQARLKGNNQELSNAERERALTEAMELQNKLAEERMALKQEEFEIQRERNKLSDTTEADLEKEAQLERDVLNIKVQSSNEQRRILSMLSGLRKQARDEEIREAAEAEQIKEKEAQAEMDLEKRKLKAKAELAVQIAGTPEEQLQAKIDKLELEKKLELESTKLIAEEKQLIEEKYNAEIAKLRNEARQEDENKWKEAFRRIANTITEGVQQFADFSRISTDNQLTNAERAKNEKLAKLEEELKARKINEDAYNQAKAEAEEGYARKSAVIKNKQAKTEKRVAIAQSIIDTAAAVVKALPNVPLSILAGLMGLANTTKIAATKIPQYAFGGMTSYASGGSVRKPSIGIIGEAGPEWVAPNWMLRSPKHANLLNYLESERKMKAFATGGPTVPGPVPAVPEAVDMRVMGAKFDMMNEKLDQLNATVAAWPTRLRVVNNPFETEAVIRARNEVDEESTIQ